MLKNKFANLGVKIFSCTKKSFQWQLCYVMCIQDTDG